MSDDGIHRRTFVKGIGIAAGAAAFAGTDAAQSSVSTAVLDERFDLDGGKTYLVELEPEDAVAADYTIEYEQYEKTDSDLSEARPLTLSGPVSAPTAISC